MKLLFCFYSPPLAGDVALCGAEWVDADGEHQIGRALILGGALLYEHCFDWPVEIIRTIAELIEKGGEEWPI